MLNEENMALYKQMFSLVLTDAGKDLILGRYTIETVASAIAKLFLPQMKLNLVAEFECGKCARDIERAMSR
ncbi:TPR domain-containing protein [Listeria marthii FSL S4-120]|uniref:TPR domain-containing protein n=1 Tax=Listeria marthii FSL S4-120 TaxID=702457 RepID=A0ABP2JWI3_9LIST|nr:TPR domain-containing protein [Listeria marthii FSL S4-120]